MKRRHSLISVFPQIKAIPLNVAVIRNVIIFYHMLLYSTHGHHMRHTEILMFRSAILASQTWGAMQDVGGPAMLVLAVSVNWEVRWSS